MGTLEDLHEQVAQLKTALDQQRRATERELSTMKRRLRATWALALVGTLGAFVLGLNPEARAQFGVTLTSLNTRLTAVETKTQFLSVSGGEMFVTGTNLHVRNGLGATNGNPADPFGTSTSATSVNGLGNLIMGYNEVDGTGSNERGGSHNLVLGIRHDYLSFGGLVAGRINRIAGPFASVSGGSSNTASGLLASVTGGRLNTAGGESSSVSGGFNNTAGAPAASVSGGRYNTASALQASVSGGQFNTAGGDHASVSGGSRNTASGVNASVSGGLYNDAAAVFSSVSGGNDRNISNAPANDFDWRAGSLFEDF